MAAELDLDELARAAPPPPRRPGRRGAPISDVQPLTGGASSLTFTGARDRGAGPAASASCSRWRRPGLEPVRNRDVARQAR